MTRASTAARLAEILDPERTLDFQFNRRGLTHYCAELGRRIAVDAEEAAAFVGAYDRNEISVDHTELYAEFCERVSAMG